jgi:hypothetical protein
MRVWDLMSRKYFEKDGVVARFDVVVSSTVHPDRRQRMVRSAGLVQIVAVGDVDDFIVRPVQDHNVRLYLVDLMHRRAENLKIR